MRISDWSSDVCSSDLDGTSDLRQAFATVLATGSSYGANHLIDVLLGRRTEKIEMAGHCDVKTFGAGVLHSRDRWRSLFRRALTGGLLEKIGRAHVCTPVTNAHLVCRILLEKTKHNTT